jgi:hypothetical protein
VSATGSTLNLSPPSKTFAAAVGTQEVTVTSNTEWTITEDAAATWCTVTPALTGSNDGAFTVSVLENTGAERTATLTVKTNDNAVTKTFVVTQEAPESPETPAPSLSEDWESGTAGTGQSAAINGWAFVKVLGNDDKKFNVVDNSGNKFAEANAYGGTALATGYEFWLISPALDISGATTKLMSFKTMGAYFTDNSSLEVYVLDSKAASTTTGTKLAVRIAETTDPKTSGFTNWISSGDIDLSSYTGTKYIGFRYQAAGGATSYRIDNFLFGAAAPKELAVSPASLSFADDDEQKPFTINSNTAWTATSSETWCSVSPENGSNDATINVTAEANDGAARSATITVSGTGVTDKTIAVTQAASGGEGSSPVSATWDFKDAATLWAANNSPCSTTPTIVGSIEIVENLTAVKFGSTNTAAAKSWGGNELNTNTADNAATTDKYATVKIKSATKSISLTTLSGNIRRSGSGPTHTALFYKIGDGNFVAGPNISNGAVTNNAGNPISADLSDIAALQNIPAGTVVTIKFVPYEATSNTGTWYLNSAGSPTTALKIEGTEQ